MLKVGQSANNHGCDVVNLHITYKLVQTTNVNEL